nr:HAMP domain-containing sensor histidine kinase [Mesobacterium pallidum]
MRRFLGTALVALVPVALALVGVIVVQDQLRMRLMDEAQARLAAEVENVAALYEQRRIIAVRQAMEYRSANGGNGAIYLLLDRDGAVLGGNLAAWPEGLAPGPASRITLDGRPYLAQAQELRGGFPMAVGVSLAPMEGTLTAMWRVFVVFGAVMLAAGLAGAALVALRAQGRVRGMNRRLDAVGAGEMALRLPEGRDDYGTLARHINAMLDRIGHLFGAHRRLGDAVAHEMRTPLARIRTQLDALDVDEAQRARLDEEIRGAIRLFDALLSIAAVDAETGNRAGLKPLDLSAVCTGIVELYQPVAEDDGRHLTADIAPGLEILGDGQLMSQLVSNLVENGLKYTRPGDTVRVDLRAQGSRIALRVSDDGPGIEAALKADLFEPFTRGAGAADRPGHGLGLSLVRAIALRHGAKLHLPEVKKGFAIELICLQFQAQEP